ncbi:MAG TPA: maleylacetoacetate isomerase [Rhizomicrobium sp.]|jgi:maleylacetoacetate isomerase|nr:maleylacetoacetate isomerase [Rhizomicrobium sp.]
MSSSTQSEFALYGYFRSSAAFRARIALNLKGIKPELRFVHLLRDGGEQHTAEYKALNPLELIPALLHNGHLITQSLAIIEYLDEIHPEPPILPRDPLGRARAREIAYVIACDIHPVNNLRLGQYLRGEIGATDEQQVLWMRHWIKVGFSALEKMLSASPHTGAFCYGDTPTIADICLIPQIFNARRVKLEVEGYYPTLARIEKHALAHPAFDVAHPKNQPDAE